MRDGERFSRSVPGVYVTRRLYAADKPFEVALKRTNRETFLPLGDASERPCVSLKNSATCLQRNLRLALAGFIPSHLITRRGAGCSAGRINQ